MGTWCGSHAARSIDSVQAGMVKLYNPEITPIIEGLPFEKLKLWSADSFVLSSLCVHHFFPVRVFGVWKRKSSVQCAQHWARERNGALLVGAWWRHTRHHRNDGQPHHPLHALDLGCSYKSNSPAPGITINISRHHPASAHSDIAV